MKILVVIDMYVPSRISAALLMRDFVREMRAQGHSPVVLVPDDSAGILRVESDDGYPIIRVPAPRTKDIGKVRRALAEWWLPRALLRGLDRSPFASEKWDGIVWYSPTIFFAPLVRAIKRKHLCRGYLIVRDLFPDWALDAGVLRDGAIYRYFKRVERGQYAVADVIGVQTPANVPLVRRDAPAGANIEVLNNWMSSPPMAPSALDLDKTLLAGRTVLAYTGNMGAAQAMDAFIDLASALRARTDIGFLFLGRGTDVRRLKELTLRLELDNVLFVDEIDSSEIPAVLAQCSVGLIALDPRHRTHNIPGKLITYLHAGLPVLARINPGNDLEGLIGDMQLGFVVVGDDLDSLKQHVLALVDDPQLRETMGRNGVAVAEHYFSPGAVVRQVVKGLSPGLPGSAE